MSAGSEPPNRSTQPADYQDLAQPIGAMAKLFFSGAKISLHVHRRDQLLYATCGIMRVQTKRDSLIVPPDRAVLVPAGMMHSVDIHGDVEMRTLYIEPASPSAVRPSTDLPTPVSRLKVLTVSPLLRELILSLHQEPVTYKPDSRAGRIAYLIEDEIECARELSLGVPLPSDPRLQKLCAAILANPSNRQTIDGWSEIIGASPRTIARLFARDLGMSFRDWRQRARFHLALEALSKGAAIASVARDNGYQSPSAFASAFSKATGLRPSDVAKSSERNL